MFGLSNRAYQKFIMFENRVLLYILMKVFERYRKASSVFVKSLPTESVWSSTLNDEETLLNQCQRLLARRSLGVKRN